MGLFLNVISIVMTFEKIYEHFEDLKEQVLRKLEVCKDKKERIEDRNKYSLELEDAENWLYEDGEFAEKPEYQKKLSELQVKGEAVKRRRYDNW